MDMAVILQIVLEKKTWRILSSLNSKKEDDLFKTFPPIDSSLMLGTELNRSIFV